MSKILRILNIGLDRELLLPGSEAQARQRFYVQNIPARIVHIVKAPPGSAPVDLGAELHIIPCSVRHWLAFIPAALRLGSQWLRRESFDLIQVQEPFVSGLIGAILAKRFSLPLVVGLYSDEIDNPVWLAESPLHPLANRLGKYVLRQAAAVRSDSAAVVQRLSHYGFRHLTCVPFLITHADKLINPDARAEEIRKQLLAGRLGPLLLAVCRLEREKNIPLMLAAVAEAARHHEGLVLAIAGDGSLANTLHEEAECLTPSSVRWLGRVNNTDMPAYYQAAQLLLISSDRESAARVLYESGLAGIPVLSTDTAGAREVIEDGITGRIVPVGDTEAFTQALITLCDKPKILAAMGMAARQRMSVQVTAQAVTAQLRLLYENALGRTA